ncbi:sulfatase-like hydrolase/transferase [Pontiellaceae bacterium B12227]|nr:sulfatase-like hydrolase/transferase [Pontiellaceae bacterium B12227]
MKKIFGMAGMVLALAVGARAAMIGGDVIAIDFGAIAPAEANWNQISTSTLSISDLQRLSDGALTGVGVTVTLTETNGDYVNNVAPGAGQGSTDASIYNDHLAANNLSGSDLITVTYAGLDDSLSYTLTGGMARSGNTTPFEQTYTVGGIDYDYTGTSGVDAYAEYTGLSSSGGVLTFTVSDYTDSDLASISQMKLTAVQVLPDGATLSLAPGALSLDLVAPDTAVDGIITASYTAGAVSSNNIEIISLVADAGFSAVAANPTLGPADTEEEFTVTFDNAGIGLEIGESTNSTLVVTWTEAGSSVTNTENIALDLTYDEDTADFWTLALDFGNVPPANHFNDISANGSYSSLVRLSDGSSVTGVSVIVDGPSFYVDGPNDSLTGLASDYDVSNVTDWAGDSDTWTVMFYGLDDSMAYNIEGVIGGFTNNDLTDMTYMQVGSLTDMFNPDTASADPRIARIEGAQSFGGVLEIFVAPNSQYPVLSTLMITAVEGGNTTNDVIAVPNIVEITVGSESNVVLSLEPVGTNYVVQQSDDLQQFSTVVFDVEGSDSVRVSGSGNVDADGDGSAFFRLERQPNFVIIFTDDQGYQDLGCFGSPNIKTPNIDQMAAEGMKFTSFYAQTVCGPSRASIMTGCYPMRVERHEDDDGSMVHPALSLNEITIPEILKPLGYKTGMSGKWDLSGRSPAGTYRIGLGPHNQGFEETFWSPTSDANPIYEAETDILNNPTRSSITRRFSDDAIQFIHANKDRPFFYYLAHPMPHTPIAASADFLGTSDGGLYGDVIEELDYHTGRVLDAVKEAGIDELTYVIFTSDNGPWWVKLPNAGFADPLRSAKTSAYDGGLRVPFIIRAPGRVPAGTTSDLVCANLDLFPTIARLAGADVPDDRVIDGVDLSDVFHGTQTELDRPFFFYQHESLRAVRRGKWKLHLVHSADDQDMVENDPWVNWPIHVPEDDRSYIEELTLYNLDDDIGETTNVASQYPEVVAELLEDLDFAKEDIGYHDVTGENSRR